MAFVTNKKLGQSGHGNPFILGHAQIVSQNLLSRMDFELYPKISNFAGNDPIDLIFCVLQRSMLELALVNFSW